MAVQIPRLKQANPTPMPQGQPVNVPVPDAASYVGARTKLITGALTGAAEYMQKLEDQTIDTEANRLANELHIWTKKRLEGEEGSLGLKYQTGNPVPLYAQFDQDFESEYNRLITSMPDVSERAKSIIKQKLNSKKNSLYLERIGLEGAQFDKYEKGITKTSVQLEAQELLNDAKKLVSGDPVTLKQFDDRLNEIGRLVGTQAVKNRQLSFGEDGQVELDANATRAILAAQSEALKNVIDVAVASKQLDVAQILLEQYGDRLDPKSKDTVLKNFEKEDIKAQAHNLVSLAEEETDIQERLDVISTFEHPNETKKELIKQEASKILNDREYRKSAAMSRASKAAFNFLHGYISDKQRGESPFTTTLEMEEDPIFTTKITQVSDAKQLKALYGLIDSPNKSDPDAVKEILEAIDGNKVGEMTPQEFDLIYGRLSKEWKSRAFSIWKNAKLDTESRQASRLARAKRYAYDLMVGSKLVPRKDRTNQQQQMLDDLTTSIVDRAAELGSGHKYEDLKEYVDMTTKQLIDEKNKEIKSGFGFRIRESLGMDTSRRIRTLPGYRNRKIEVPKPESQPAVPKKDATTPNPISTLSDKELGDLMKEYSKKNRGAKPTPQQLMDFYNSRIK